MARKTAACVRFYVLQSDKHGSRKGFEKMCLHILATCIAFGYRPSQPRALRQALKLM